MVTPIFPITLKLQMIKEFSPWPTPFATLGSPLSSVLAKLRFATVEAAAIKT